MSFHSASPLPNHRCLLLDLPEMQFALHCRDTSTRNKQQA